MQVETDSVSRVQNKNARQIKIFIKLLDFWLNILYLYKANSRYCIHHYKSSSSYKADSSAFSLRGVATFFECEMKISYKEYISESENVEDSN